jgi:hypothetical protein
VIRTPRHRLAAGIGLFLTLAACGGGGDDQPQPSHSLRWETPRMVVRIPEGATNTIYADTRVVFSGSPMPPIVGINLSPYGGGNPRAGTGVSWADANGVAPVRLVVSPNTRGEYPLGEHTISASTGVGATTYRATLTLVVE